MYENILLPTDGSKSMERVMEHTVEVAAQRDATVHVLYVVDDRAFLTLRDDMLDDVVAELESTGRRAIRKATERLESADVTTVTSMRQGNPAEEILDYVAMADVDLVTMGTHGADYEKNMLGSVSQRVVSSASVPVLTVKVVDAE